jgi:predicted transcriptional regulator
MENTTTQDEGKMMMRRIVLFIKEKRLVLGMTQGDLADKVLATQNRKAILVKLNLERRTYYKCSR